MYWIIFFLYNGIFIPLLYLGAGFAAIFNRKIRRGLVGRVGWRRRLAERLSRLPAELPRVWVHISSLGEFEQVKPVLKLLKQRPSPVAVILSFYSPSGFDHAQKYEFADVVTYLPADTWFNARRFLSTLRPSIAAVVRHDIWPNFQWRLHRIGVPSILMDASVTPHRRISIDFFHRTIRQVYDTFDGVLATSEASVPMLRRMVRHAERIRVLGDTRFDQVYERAQETGRISDLADSGQFDRRGCLVAGSIWPQDEKALLPAVARVLGEQLRFTCILVPHEISAAHLESVEDFFREQGYALARLSQFRQNPGTLRVLLVDQIGLLANLYALAAMAYVGGGFGTGIHSVLEPAAHGAAVYFGPRHTNSMEALSLIRNGGGCVLRNSEDFYQAIGRLFSAPHEVEAQGQRAFRLVQENLGASARTVEVLLEYLGHRSPHHE